MIGKSLLQFWRWINKPTYSYLEFCILIFIINFISELIK